MTTMLAAEITYRVERDASVTLSQKQCSACHLWLGWDAFYWNGDYQRSECKQCQLARTRKRLKNRGVCQTCGGPRFDPAVPGDCIACYRAKAPQRQAAKRWEAQCRAYELAREREERLRLASRVRERARAPLLRKLEQKQRQEESIRSRAAQAREAWKIAGRAEARAENAARRAAALEARAEANAARRAAALEAARQSPVVTLSPDVQERVYQTVAEVLGDKPFVDDIAGEVLLLLLNGELVAQATKRVLRMEFNARDLSLDAVLTTAFDGSSSFADALEDNSDTYVEFDSAAS